MASALDGRDSLPAAPARRRIVVVDDHLLVRRGLTALIDDEPDIVVCAAAATRDEALAAIAGTQPDLVIADLSLGNDDGLVLVRDIRAAHADLPVLVLTIHDSAACAEQAFRAGAGGYVSKQEIGAALLDAIRAVLAGARYASPKIAAAIAATRTDHRGPLA